MVVILKLRDSKLNGNKVVVGLIRLYCTSFNRTKEHCNVGTIGHVDHGKTTLTAAITKVLSKVSGKGQYVSYENIDKSKEERERGITITASHVEYETEKRHYAHIDCPGHQNYIKNMITGVTQMDGAILVVSLVDGPQEQTNEHILLAREIGIKYLIVYLNKLDMVVEEELPEMVEFEVIELLEFYKFPNSDLVKYVRGSARVALEEEVLSDVGGLSVVSLMNFVDEVVKIPESKDALDFLMCIESVYNITGRGTVVTGVVEQGSIVVGDSLELVGLRKSKEKFVTVCMGLEMFRKVLTSGRTGDNLGVLIRGVKRDEVLRGQVLSKPGSLKAYKTFKAKVYILGEDEGGRSKPVKTGYKPQFFIRYANITGTLMVENGEVILSGDSGEVMIDLLLPVALIEGQRFTVREGKLTIGTGLVTEVIES